MIESVVLFLYIYLISVRITILKPIILLILLGDHSVALTMDVAKNLVMFLDCQFAQRLKQNRRQLVHDHTGLRVTSNRSICPCGHFLRRHENYIDEIIEIRNETFINVNR